MIPGSLGIDGLTIDTVCVDELNCASLAGYYSQQTAWTPRSMSTNVANPRAVTPVLPN